MPGNVIFTSKHYYPRIQQLYTLYAQLPQLAYNALKLRLHQNSRFTSLDFLKTAFSHLLPPNQETHTAPTEGEDEGTSKLTKRAIPHHAKRKTATTARKRANLRLPPAVLLRRGIGQTIIPSRSDNFRVIDENTIIPLHSRPTVLVYKFRLIKPPRSGILANFTYLYAASRGSFARLRVSPQKDAYTHTLVRVYVRAQSETERRRRWRSYGKLHYELPGDYLSHPRPLDSSPPSRPLSLFQSLIGAASERRRGGP